MLFLSVLFTILQAYEIISCDVLCDYDYVPLHCLRNKRKEKEKSNQIKENKENQNKI